MFCYCLMTQTIYLAYQKNLERYSQQNNLFITMLQKYILYVPKHLSSSSVLVGFVLLNLQLSVQFFVDHCLSFCLFSFVHCIVCPSTHGLYSPLWYLKKLFFRQMFSLQQCYVASNISLGVDFSGGYFTLLILTTITHFFIFHL